VDSLEKLSSYESIKVRRMSGPALDLVMRILAKAGVVVTVEWDFWGEGLTEKKDLITSGVFLKNGESIMGYTGPIAEGKYLLLKHTRTREGDKEIPSSAAEGVRLINLSAIKRISVESKPAGSLREMVYPGFINIVLDGAPVSEVELSK